MSNRATRRALRAQAKAVAAKCAAACYDYTPAGAMVRVENPRAVAVLRRAFETMLRQGQPVTLQISEAEASAFPRWSGASAGMTHALAIGLDPEGRCSFALRSAVARGLTTGHPHPLASSEAAEQAAREGLAEITSYAGFPAIHQKGGRS